MSEAAPEAPVETSEQAPEAEQPKTYDEDYVSKLRAEAAKYRTQLREVEGQRKASMTESERAIAEAREAAAAEVRTEYGKELAQTRFEAEAARVNPEYDVAKALKYVNLAGFLGDDGRPDSKAIAAAVADLIPAATSTTPPPPSFDGGARTSAPAGASMTDLIRQAAGRG